MMRPDHWDRVNTLFHQALDRPAAERPAFLRQASAGDEALVNEVASLLEAHDDAGAFMEPPALGAGGDVAESLVGRTLGHYRIERVLGEGGMGVVYLAEDTRLSRPVALKALPARYTRDPVSRDRLRREARAAAALTHPGIATVYALEELDGLVCIAFEFVPGETLRAELARGPLSLPTVVATAAAIARALAAAHDRGIIHRDLKPENVIRTPDGQIKILDFGLARFREPSALEVTLTALGSVMGTPAHMSPEQIRGEPVDARSDVFSFGVLVYELASGTNPFAGVDPAATLANILEARPPRLAIARVTDADRLLAARLDRVIEGCLQRAPDARFVSVRALLQALTEPAEPAGPADDTPVDRPSRAQSRAEPPRDPQALWWWKFHQGVTSLTYLALLVPLWFVHEWMVGLPALLVFLAGLIPGLVASLLRLHLWFTVRSYPDEWPAQRRAAGRWIAAADVTFAGVLVVAALMVLTDHSRMAAALVAAAVAVVLSFAVIEPATTRAAFDTRSTRW
jgi:serine/threonine protein kinase